MTNYKFDEKNIGKIYECIENIWDESEDFNEITYAISLFLQRLYKITLKGTDVSIEEFLETTLDHIKHNCIAIGIRHSLKKD